jgi:hypoxanthine phosphoribosyltransferase
VTDQPRFAHASEAELARILDYYGVRWEYEPRTFPILWNTDGKVVESFSPDFYLPELDTYVELTTLKQSLVRRKNRKLRRLRELYPDIKVKLFYGKDFRALMLKYGRFDLAASLSGLEGQLMPERLDAQPTLRVAIPAALVIDVEPRHEEQEHQPALVSVSASESRPSRGTRRRRGRRAFIGADES